MSLTINQEKKIRAARNAITAGPGGTLKIYHELAGKVASYRRAQKLSQSKEASELRRSLLGEIDAILQRLQIL